MTIQFPYQVITHTITHRQVMRRKRHRNVQVRVIAVALIVTTLIILCNVFIPDAKTRALVILGIVALQLITFNRFSGMSLFFYIVKKSRMHKESSPLKNKLVRVKAGVPEIGGKMMRVEDWVDCMPSKKSWMDYGPENHATMNYALRKGLDFDENDLTVDEVLYGKVEDNKGFWLGYVVHIDELELPTES